MFCDGSNVLIRIVKVDNSSKIDNFVQLCFCCGTGNSTPQER
jgi:hypothetical protein